jgi:hypothetical protein
MMGLLIQVLEQKNDRKNVQDHLFDVIIFEDNAENDQITY